MEGIHNVVCLTSKITPEINDFRTSQYNNIVFAWHNWHICLLNIVLL